MDELLGVEEIKNQLRDKDFSDPTYRTADEIAIIIRSYRFVIQAACNLIDPDDIEYSYANKTFVYPDDETESSIGEYHRGVIDLILSTHGLSEDSREVIMADMASIINWG